jgi:protoheme IX farnesyltransferase
MITCREARSPARPRGEIDFMKATTQSLTQAHGAEKSLAATLAELAKARLTSLVLLTTAVGFYMGSARPVEGWLLLHTLVGTALLAGGAAALNQLIERRLDARMRRTENRPLPSGRLQPNTVLVLGGVGSALGLIHLAVAVNLLTSLLGAVTLVSYLFVYTPLKRVTTLNTAIGAIPGALPPLMGWTAAQGEITAGGWALFAILAFWQLPHFLAIAWLYREDYERGGFVMLPVVDRDGRRTGRQAVSHTLGLLFISLFPALMGMAGWVYFAGAFALGAAFLAFAILFCARLTDASARRLFLMSIVYLPLLLGLMVLDKLGSGGG